MTTRIIRVPRRHRFSQIDNRAIEDERLSWAARGLLVYILSRPDKWKIIVNHLVKQGDLRRDGIHGLLRELRRYRYVRFVQIRDGRGRITGSDYFVQEAPDAPEPALPDTALPDTVTPDTAAPDTAKPDALTNTNREQRTTTTTTDDDRGGGGYGPRVEKELYYPETILPSERTAVAGLIDPLPNELRQPVLDEWAGIIAAGAIRSSPIACLRALIERARDEKFTLERGLRIQHARESHQRIAVALEEARTKVPNLPAPNEGDELIRRLLAIRNRPRRGD